jgi:hypothetical protein
MHHGSDLVGDYIAGRLATQECCIPLVRKKAEGCRRLPLRYAIRRLGKRENGSDDGGNDKPLPES